MRKILLSLVVLAGLVSQASAADNYAATAGSGLTFGAKDATGVLYSRFIGCDNTTVSQCWAVDASGRLTVNINGTVTTSISTWGGGTLGAMANYGTSPGAVLVPGVNAFITNTNANGQATMANSSPVVLPSNMSAIALWGHGATGAAVPANATYFGFNSGGNLTGPATATPLPVRSGDGTRQVVLDACEANAQSYANGVITSATTTRIITPSASNKTYVCSMLLTASAADNVGIVEGTGGTCGTGTAGVVGGTTAANGPNFVANGGLMMQAGGKVAVAQTAGTNVDFCLITSSAGPLTYSVKYVQAP